MTKRIFRSIVFAALLVLLASAALIIGVLYNHFTTVQLNQLRVETALAAHAVDHEGIRYFDQLDNTMDCRITWIDTDGTVLYDNRSDSGSMENHLEREEVKMALESGFGQSSRYSDTQMEQYIYAAERLPDGTVLRLSTARSSILMLMVEISRHIVLIVAIILVLAMTLAKRLARNIVHPLNELNLDNPLSGGNYEELNPLLRRIESQWRQLQGQETELKRKQREFDTVIRNMNEGLVLMSAHCSVLTMNAAAARIMGLPRAMVGINFLDLTQAAGMKNVVGSGLEGRHSEDILEISGKVYQIDASPVHSGGEVSGLALLIIDITEKKHLEDQRREFTANVSHELKTPLHAISGYAELLKSGFVKDCDVPAFLDKIYTESRRMVKLIEDILRLSHLDEERGGMQREVLDLHVLAFDVVRDLADTAKKREVSLELIGTSCPMIGISHLVGAIITNLCTNAIKYNRPGGFARVEIREETEEAVLTVSDSGIGIPPEHQERIFERFYRVDKSHSKAVGGTGLGLSIVKHACQILGARITLESTEGKGTKVEVRFPKN